MKSNKLIIKSLSIRFLSEGKLLKIHDTVLLANCSVPKPCRFIISVLKFKIYNFSPGKFAKHLMVAK